MRAPDPILLRAEFDRRLPVYFMLQAQLLMLCTVVTIPLMPIWLLLARGLHRRQYESLRCELTARAHTVRRGVLLKVQQSIPLDKITDLALYEGPLLRRLGLCSLRIETAGGGQAAATGQAMLPGVVDAEAFRDRVLAQRDAVVLDGAGATAATLEVAAHTPAASAAPSAGAESVLMEIRDTLRRIEERLAARSRD
jgi:putative membrane protein